ncbi:MAG: hypothetical protein M0P01_10630 [Treponema sp.]|nr:hypothetical protein [Treponema sp.]
MDLQTLLITELVPALCSRHGVKSIINSVQAPTETTAEEAFDLLDKKNHIVQQPGEGGVTYHNPDKENITVTDYEKFVNSLPKSWQTGVKRCDFLIYRKDENTFFVCNELSQSRNINSKESDALYQLEQTLKTLTGCPRIKDSLDQCNMKICLFSNRIPPIHSPQQMADAFDVRRYLNLPKAAEATPYEPFEKYGFTYYKATGVTVQSWKLSFDE